MSSQQITEKELSLNDQKFFLSREKNEVKKTFSTKFLGELNNVLVKCFAPSKKKKENFITQERIELDILKLLQSQKRFRTGQSIHNELINLAVYDNIENIIARIVSVNHLTHTVTIVSLPYLRSTQKTKERHFNEIDFFDYTSIRFEHYFEKQKRFFDDISYKETFCFLHTKENILETVVEKSKPQEKAHYSHSGGVKMVLRFNKESDLNDDVQTMKQELKESKVDTSKLFKNKNEVDKAVRWLRKEIIEKNIVRETVKGHVFRLIAPEGLIFKEGKKLIEFSSNLEAYLYLKNNPLEEINKD